MLVLREEAKPLFQEDKEMIRHLVEFADVAVCVDVAETSSDRVINEKQVGEFVPRAVVVLQFATFPYSVGTDLHQSAIHTTASGAAIKPDDGSLSVGDVAVLVVPEEQVSVMLIVDLNVSVGC